MEHMAKLVFKVQRPAYFSHRTLHPQAGSGSPGRACWSWGKKEETSLPKTCEVHVDLTEAGQALKEATAWTACPQCTLLHGPCPASSHSAPGALAGISGRSYYAWREALSHWNVPINLKSGCDGAGPSMGVCIFMQQSPET